MGSISSFHHNTIVHFYYPLSSQSNHLYTQFISFSKFPFFNSNSLQSSNRCLIVPAKNKNRSPEPVITPSIVEEVSEVDEFEEFDDVDFDDDGIHLFTICNFSFLVPIHLCNFEQKLNLFLLFKIKNLFHL